MPKLVVFEVDAVLLDTEVGGFKLLAEAIGKAEAMIQPPLTNVLEFVHGNGT